MKQSQGNNPHVDNVIHMLDHMTLHEKIGQLLMVATTSYPGKTSELLASREIQNVYNMEHHYIEQCIKDYHIGGLIFLGVNDTHKQIELTNHFQQLSKEPLLIGQDCEWGLGMRHSDAVSFPKAMELAATDNEALIYEIGNCIGHQCKEIGVHINFAPVVDVHSNPNNPIINSRAFGDDPEKVTRFAGAFMRGLQDAGILSCIKHFPGHGDTDVDSHLALPIINRTRPELDSTELYPFQQLIKAGCDAVMIGHLVVPALQTKKEPATVSYEITTELLKHELGFNGLIFTDGMGMRAIIDHYEPGYAECQAILAGVDMIVCPVNVPKTVECLKQAIKQGLLSMQALDSKVLKILKLKHKLGLYNERFVELKELDNECANRLKREAIQQSNTGKLQG